MENMSKRKRIQAALAGDPVDRVPVGFWRHFPGDDQRADTLAAVTLEFQRQYDLDFIKFPVSSVYCIADYGIKHEYQGSPAGTRVYLERAIKKIDDWDKIEPLDIHKGVYGWHLQSLRQVINEKPEDTPVVVTIFNPLAMAFYLAGDETALAHLRQYPVRFERALEALTKTCADFVREVINAGADGIFLSAKSASYEVMNEQEYEHFGRPSDLSVLEAAKSGWFNILHLHGQYPMFNQLAGYPVQAVNWHDRTTYPNLIEASNLFKGALMGGVEQYKLLHFGNPEDVGEQVKNAIQQMDGRRLIVTPGCTYPVTVPHSNLKALRNAVETS
jgi:uroporphyrinogen decarboxylase